MPALGNQSGYFAFYELIDACRAFCVGDLEWNEDAVLSDQPVSRFPVKQEMQEPNQLIRSKPFDTSGAILFS
jgi:hypothetical protein